MSEQEPPGSSAPPPPRPSTEGEGRPEEEDLPHCSCGFDRYHVMVSPEREYTAWGTFWVVLMGVSARPIRIRFKCRVCGEAFDMTDDPAELKKFL